MFSSTSPGLTLPCIVDTLLRRRGGRQRLHVPDHVRILLNAAITGEKPHAAHARDALADPLLLILVRLIDEVLRLDIAVEVVADEVVIAVVDDAVAEGREAARVAEHAALDRVEDFGEIRVQLERPAVVVRVPQVFDVFGQVAEEEDVRFADFACDFDLCEDLVGVRFTDSNLNSGDLKE